MKRVKVPAIPQPQKGNLMQMMMASKRADKMMRRAVLESKGTMRIEKISNGKTAVTHILSKSSRKGVDYQLTSFDKSGPSGHMDIKGSLKENLSRIIRELPKSSSSSTIRLSYSGKSRSRRAKATSGASGG